MDWAFPYGQDELAVFLQETEEQLQTLESGLLDLEQAGADAERLAAVFRAAHTLKGAAGTVGHGPLTQVTHAMESVLDALRAGRLACDANLEDALLRALDRLREMQAAIAAGGGGGEDVSAELAMLQAFGAGGGTPAPTGNAAPPQADVAAGSPATGTAAEAAPAAGAREPTAQAADGAHAAASPRWHAAVRFAATCAMPSVRAYQALVAAEGCGRVVEVSPSREEIERERVADRLAMTVVGCEQQALAAVLQRVPDVAEVRLTPGDGAPAAPAAASAPQRSVRIDVALLDRLMNLVGELVVDRTRLSRTAGRLDQQHEDTPRQLAEIAGHLWRVTSDLQDEVMRARLLPVETLFRKFPRLVRDAARQTGKQIHFVVEGQDTELDRSMLEQIGDPLMHMLRNAVDHGIEPAEARRGAGKAEAGTVRLTAQHGENHIVITVEDDGAGIDPDRLRRAAVARDMLSEEAARRLTDDEAVALIFGSGFTTREQATALSGRGVGMDVVKRNIERLNGSVHVETRLGEGSRFVVRLPLTLAIVHALLVRIRETAIALPLHAIMEVARLAPEQISTVQGSEVVQVRGRVLPLLRGGRVLGETADPEPAAGRPFIHLHAGGQPVALLVDELLGQQEVVIKGLDHHLVSAPGFTGAAILADGQVALVVDPASLLRVVAAVA